MYDCYANPSNICLIKDSLVGKLMRMSVSGTGLTRWQVDWSDIAQLSRRAITEWKSQSFWKHSEVIYSKAIKIEDILLSSSIVQIKFSFVVSGKWFEKRKALTIYGVPWWWLMCDDNESNGAHMWQLSWSDRRLFALSDYFGVHSINNSNQRASQITFRDNFVWRLFVHQRIHQRVQIASWYFTNKRQRFIDRWINKWILTISSNWFGSFIPWRSCLQVKKVKEVQLVERFPF